MELPSQTLVSATSEELQQTLLARGLNFSSLERVEEREDVSAHSMEWAFGTSGAAGSEGFVQLSRFSLHNLRDRELPLCAPSEPLKPGQVECMYVIAELTTCKRAPPRTKRLGVDDRDKWAVRPTDEVMRSLSRLDDIINKSKKQHSPEEQDEAAKAWDATESELIKLQSDKVGGFSSLAIRSGSDRDSIRFPGHSIWLHYDRAKTMRNEPVYLAFKVFKCNMPIEDAVDAALMRETDALSQAQTLRKALDQAVTRQEKCLVRRKAMQLAPATGNGAPASVNADLIRQGTTQLAQLRASLQELDASIKEKEQMIQRLKQSSAAVPEDAGSDHRRRQDGTHYGQPKLVGVAYMQLDQLLDSLRDGNDQLQELASLVTADYSNMGMLMFNCQFRERRAKPAMASLPLDMIELAMDNLAPEKFGVYPDRHALRVEWRVPDHKAIKRGDFLLLVPCSGGHANLSSPLYFFIWMPEDGNEPDGKEDWRVLEDMEKMHDTKVGQVSMTDPSGTRGTVLFPSAPALKLLPGRYGLYWTRNEADSATGTKVRVVLGRSPPLVVVPDVSGNHVTLARTVVRVEQPVSAALRVTPARGQARVRSVPVHEEEDSDFVEREEGVSMLLEQIQQVRRDELEQVHKDISKLRTTQARQKDELEQYGNELITAPERDSVDWPSDLFGRRQVDEVTSSDVVYMNDATKIEWVLTGSKEDASSEYDSIVMLPSDVVDAADALGAVLMDCACRLPIEGVLHRVAVICERYAKQSYRGWLKTTKAAYQEVLARSPPTLRVEEQERLDALEIDIKTIINRASKCAQRHKDLVLDFVLEGVMAEQSFWSKHRLVHAIGAQIHVSPSRESATTLILRNVLATRTPGLYTALYFREGGDRGPLQRELGRCGPFVVQAGDSRGSSDKHGLSRMGVRISILLALFFVRYFLALVGLSFNVTVLSGSFPNVNIQDVIDDFRAEMRELYGPIGDALAAVHTFFNNCWRELVGMLSLFSVDRQCHGGFLLYPTLALLLLAMLVIFVVVREDLLITVQKLYRFVPFKLTKTQRRLAEQVASVLVTPVAIIAKSCVLFIASTWVRFAERLDVDPRDTWHNFDLHRDSTPDCPDRGLAQLNLAFGSAALGVILTVLFALFPLLLLHLYGARPVTKQFSSLSFDERVERYGFFGQLWRLLLFYAWEMLTTLFHPLVVLITGVFQYKTLRSAVTAMVQFVKRQIVMPIVCVAHVTVGLWSETPWRTYDVAARGDRSYELVSSAELKQLQIMSIQGQLVSLLWMCVPRAMVLGYLAEAANRAPVAAYLTNRRFFRAVESDMAEGSMDGSTHSTSGMWGTLQRSRFVMTMTKWVCAVIELVCLVLVQHATPTYKRACVAVSSLVAFVPNMLDFADQARSTYVDHVQQPVDVPEDTELTKLGYRGDEMAAKQLISLQATPESLVLGMGMELQEQIAVDWQVNSKQRFHPLDAIGMFVASESASGDAPPMAQCITFRLLRAGSEAERIGWKPQSSSVGSDVSFDVNDRSAMHDHVRDAQKLANLLERVECELKVTMDDNGGVDETEMAAAKAEIDKLLAGRAVQGGNLGKVLTQTYADIKRSDGLYPEVKTASVSTTERSITRGRVKFRRVKSELQEDDPLHEVFVHGNDAGVFDANAGSQRVEFYYLRYVESGDESDNVDSKQSQKVAPQTPVPTLSRYQIMERFPSNAVAIATYSICATLTSDDLVVKPNESINLAWEVSGISYSILSNPKARSAITLYPVGTDRSALDPIEVPSSAFSEADESEACSGRMSIRAPTISGLYEVRFMINTFKNAGIRRACQYFASSQDKLPSRVRHGASQRSNGNGDLVANALEVVTQTQWQDWRSARRNVYVWLYATIVQTVRAPVKTEILEAPSEYGEYLSGTLRKRFRRQLDSKSPVHQARLAAICAPLQHDQFLAVLRLALASNTGSMDVLRTILFEPRTATANDTNGKTDIRVVQCRWLPTDDEILQCPPAQLSTLATQFLQGPSLFGLFDRLDDLLITNSHLQDAIALAIWSVAEKVAVFYQPIIHELLERVADRHGQSLGTSFARNQSVLLSTSRQYLATIIHAALTTDFKTGAQGHRKVPTGEPSKEPIVIATIQHAAARQWAMPYLHTALVNALKDRYARLMTSVGSAIRQGILVRGMKEVAKAAVYPDFRSFKPPFVLYHVLEKIAHDAEGVSSSVGEGDVESGGDEEDEYNDAVDEDVNDEEDEDVDNC